MNIETFKVKGWKDAVTVVILLENKDWILAKQVVSDYIIDGFVLYKKKYIRKRTFGPVEAQLKTIFTLRKISEDIPKGFEFGSTSNLLKWTEKNYGISVFQDGDNSPLSVAKIIEIKKKKFLIDLIMDDGTLTENYDYEFALKKVRVICFDSTYQKSMVLLYKSKVSKIY